MTEDIVQGFSGTGEKKSRKQQIVAAFVAFHVFILVLFAAPIDISPICGARDTIAPYMRFIGLSDRWDTFAPNPKSAEQFIKAVVITESGQYSLYSFPRMEDLSFTGRYCKERYRKFAESLLCGECSGLWPDVERAIARQRFDPKDPPARVILIKFESPINPKTDSIGDDTAAKPTVLAQMEIKPEDLK
jgi:hypothetical protein